MKNSVYLNASSSFFPNAPVGNDVIEDVLGKVGGRPSKAKRVVLESNQIKTRYYAIDPQTRASTHSNAQMTSAAIKRLFHDNPELDISKVEMMTCGTSAPDVLVPAHGQMVQGELTDLNCEVITTAGVCCSSSAALKIAYLSILSGDKTSAVVTGSESSSKFMRSEFIESENQIIVDGEKKLPPLSFDHDFLRWMLSDGASALYLSNEVVPGKINLKINWIEGFSFANEEKVCMLGGAFIDSNDNLVPWKDLRVSGPADARLAMSIRQDIRQLQTRVFELTVERPLVEIKKNRGIRPGDYSWFLPHYSSHYFRPMLMETLNKIDFDIPSEKWFTTLYERGNIGSASIMVFIDELKKQKQLNSGDKILCFIPESARFSSYFMELEVVTS
jgi:3-oxoacyl-[acyl-carrier-protein] synthase III